LQTAEYKLQNESRPFGLGCRGAIRVVPIQFSILLLLLVSLTPVRAAVSAEPPLVGRPTHAPFSGAIGSFHPTVGATPTELQAEDPLLFSIRLTADGPVWQAPTRPDLRELPAFAERFFIEDVATPDESPSGRQGWEFVYRLRPRSPAVRAIPSFPFVYFQPGMLPAAKGYMTRWAPSIDLRVRPRDEVKWSDVEASRPPVSAPATVFEFVDGDQVIRREKPEAVPGAAVLSVIAIGPPLACLMWFMVWSRVYPNAARRARQRRSRAARLALKQIRAAARLPANEQIECVARVVADYLRQRFDLPAAEPTPAEVAAHLRRVALPEELADHAARFFAECATARFGPVGPANLAAFRDAEPLILGLEDASWRT
jgi:hypothetical protein